MTEKLEAVGIFNRKTLRRTILCTNEDRSRFMIVTRVLDRDSLQVSTLRSMYLAESLEIIVGLYLTNFCPNGVVRI